jgi:hypothetical protein
MMHSQKNIKLSETIWTIFNKVYICEIWSDESWKILVGKVTSIRQVVQFPDREDFFFPPYFFAGLLASASLCYV